MNKILEAYNNEARKHDNVELANEDDIINLYVDDKGTTYCCLTTDGGKNNFNVISTKKSSTTIKDIMSFCIYLWEEKGVEFCQVYPANKWKLFGKLFNGYELDGVLYFSIREAINDLKERLGE